MRDAPQEETLELALPPMKVKTRREGERATKEVVGVRWTKYTAAKRHKCDTCVLLVHTGEDMHAPGLAMYRRTQGATTEYLCFKHTQEQRARDGLALLKK